MTTWAEQLVVPYLSKTGRVVLPPGGSDAELRALAAPVPGRDKNGLLKLELVRCVDKFNKQFNWISQRCNQMVSTLTARAGEADWPIVMRTLNGKVGAPTDVHAKCNQLRCALFPAVGDGARAVYLVGPTYRLWPLSQHWREDPQPLAPVLAAHHVLPGSTIYLIDDGELVVSGGANCAFGVVRVKQLVEHLREMGMRKKAAKQRGRQMTQYFFDEVRQLAAPVSDASDDDDDDSEEVESGASETAPPLPSPSPPAAAAAAKRPRAPAPEQPSKRWRIDETEADVARSVAEMLTREIPTDNASIDAALAELLTIPPEFADEVDELLALCRTAYMLTPDEVHAFFKIAQELKADARATGWIAPEPAEAL